MALLTGAPLGLFARALGMSLAFVGVLGAACFVWDWRRLTAAHDEGALKDAQPLASHLVMDGDPARPLAEMVAEGIHEARRAGLERAFLEAGRYLEVWAGDGTVLYRSPNLLGQPLEPPPGASPGPGVWRATVGRVRAPGRPAHRLRLLTGQPTPGGPILRIAYYPDGIHRDLIRFALRLGMLGLPVALFLATGFTWILRKHASSTPGPYEGAGRDPLHDIRTSLNILRGEVDVVLQRRRSAADYRATLSCVLEETVALSAAINHLADSPRAVTRSEEEGPVPLADVLGPTLRRLRPLALLKGVRLRADLEAHVVVRGDRRELQRLFLNLLENAIRFTPRAGGVDVRLGTTADEAQVIIEDTGPGIPEADLAHIFERGFRGSRGGGWGLGLPIALAIARAHGGTIEAGNRPGGGARIVVRLPPRGPGGAGAAISVALAVTMTVGAAGAWAAAAPPDLPLGLRQEELRTPPGGAPSAAIVDLGRRLFFEPRLSADGSVSCASCHRPEHAFADARTLSVGAGGRSPRRHTPTLLNRAFGTRFFWDGRGESLEALVQEVLELPAAMGNRVPAAVAWLSGDGGYRRGFREAFGGPLTPHSLATALAAYLRTIYSSGSPYDRFEAGDASALTPAARRGLALFRGRAGCAQCHSGPNFTDEGFHNTGLGVYDPAPDLGRHIVTKRDEDKGAFKTPTLRDVARRPPYMHDGSLTTLQAVVAYYARGGTKNPFLDPRLRPLGLSQGEQADLLAFLRSLTGSPARPAAP